MLQWRVGEAPLLNYDLELMAVAIHSVLHDNMYCVVYVLSLCFMISCYVIFIIDGFYKVTVSFL